MKVMLYSSRNIALKMVVLHSGFGHAGPLNNVIFTLRGFGIPAQAGRLSDLLHCTTAEGF